MRYVVSGLVIVVGIALLLLPNTFMIRWTNISWGWLALGLGVISLGFDIMKGRRGDDSKDDAPGRI